MVNNSMQNRLGFVDVHSSEQGLKVVTAQFKDVEPFSWTIFDGFDRMRVLTYSASSQMIVKMLERYHFSIFECIFGYEGGLQQVADVVKSQQLLNNPEWDYSLQLKNKWQRIIYEKILAGRARFYVVKDSVAHSKLYLLETNGGERRRVIVGSANLSKRAFGGKQPETLVVFDNDAKAWEHYSREYDSVKMTASDRIDYAESERQWPEAKPNKKDLRESTDDEWESDETPATVTSSATAREVALQLERDGITQTEIANTLNSQGFTYRNEGGLFTQQRVWHLLNPSGITERESRLRGK